jgi:hypothetical protein
LKLSEPVELNNNVQIACLPKEQSSSYPKAPVDAYIIGWGINQLNLKNESLSKIPDALQNAKILIYDPIFCMFREKYYEQNSQICAGNYSGLVDSCHGMPFKLNIFI